MAASAAVLAALKRDNSELAEHSEAFLEATAELCAEHASTPKHARSLAYNLGRNVRLRRQLLSGEITVAELCAMDPNELAPDQIKSARAEQSKRAEFRRHLGMSAAFSLTRSVRCPECGGREARFEHNGADARDWHGRKNEVWGSKHDEDEGPACYIICTACEHAWHGEAPEPVIEEEVAPPRRGILGWKGSLRE